MRTTVFICYSHADRACRDELTTHLAACSDSIEVWSDKSIPAGVQWLPEIDRALTRADAAVIIVSSDLLASEFVRKRELPRILERHEHDGMRPLWLHYRPAAYTRTPLARFQALHDPRMPLSKLRRPDRETALVNIANKICDASPQRSVANLLRAADEVMIGETKSVPSVLAKVGPDRIDMQEMGGKTRLFVTKQALDQRLGPEERRILRTHEKAMDALVRRWERLHPKVAAGANSGLSVQLASVREALAREFDSAIQFITSLGYALDDHYYEVRHVLSPGTVFTSTPAPATPVARVPNIKPTIGVRFVLNGKGKPQYSRNENGYWLQTWLNDAPERTSSVVWRMHPTVSPKQETVDTPKEFRKDFVAYGDFTIRADLRTKRRTPMARLERTLSSALLQEYPSSRSAPIQQAIDDIAAN